MEAKAPCLSSRCRQQDAGRQGCTAASGAQQAARAPRHLPLLPSPSHHVLSSGFSCLGKPQLRQLTQRLRQRLHDSQRLAVVMLGGCVEPTPRVQISWFSSPAATVAAAVQEGTAPRTNGEINTGLGRSSPSLGGGKGAPCPHGFGRRTRCAQGSCSLAASDGGRGSSGERTLVRQRNPFSHHL